MRVKMMKTQVVLFILILFAINVIWCESEIYGFGLGSRHEGDKLIFSEELDSNDTLTDLWAPQKNLSIFYTYSADQPVSFVEVRTAFNLYTEITFENAHAIHIRLTEFNSYNFNATLYVYGFENDNNIPDDFTALLNGYPEIIEQNKRDEEEFRRIFKPTKKDDVYGEQGSDYEVMLPSSMADKPGTIKEYMEYFQNAAGQCYLFHFIVLMIVVMIQNILVF